MKVLVLNCGSSSLKYQLFNMDDESVMAKGLVEKIGLDGSELSHSPAGQERSISRRRSPIMPLRLSWWYPRSLTKNMRDQGYAGDRRGGSPYHPRRHHVRRVLFNHRRGRPETGRTERSGAFTQSPSILGIRACQEKIPGVPMVGVFDTAFHQTMPPSSYLYGLPYEYYEKYQMRRYGFHGTSHRFVSARCLELLGNPVHSKIITCHLGNGSSVAAIVTAKPMILPWALRRWKA